MEDERLMAVDEAWVAEAGKRFSAWKRKTVKAVSAEKALRDMYKELRHRRLVDPAAKAEIRQAFEQIQRHPRACVSLKVGFGAISSNGFLMA